MPQAAVRQAPFVFDRMLVQGVQSGYLPGRTAESMNWYRKRAQREKSIIRQQIIAEGFSGHRNKVDIRVGTMFMFSYDPKLKEELPFYDTFPLCIVIDHSKNGFLGLNLHYLPLQARAKLMDALYTIVSDDRLTHRTKISATYGILKNATKFRMFKPCLKKYLYGHVRSRFVEIYPAEWDMALFLPVQNFQKATDQKVYRWSARQYKS